MFLAIVIVALLTLGAGATRLEGAMEVILDPSVSSPAPVGTLVRWQAYIADANPGTLWYRFRAREVGASLRTIRDFGPLDALDWTASDHEGAYEIEVTVRNRDTGETATASERYEMLSRVTGGAPVISETANPLVFLYSAPACPAGSRMRVQFRSPEGNIQSTPNKPCRPGLSMNFYLAGMRANATYTVSHTIDDVAQPGAAQPLRLTTPEVDLNLAAYQVIRPATGDGILLLSTPFQVTTATDLNGNLVWYYSESLTFLTRPAEDGLFLGILQDYSADESYQIVRCFDLAGVTVQETNAARINEQLVKLGRRKIGSFHHEALRLPAGKILVLASNEQVMTDVYRPGSVNVIGEAVLVLDQDLRVVWSWDAFDHLDLGRQALLGHTCAPGAGGCPPLYQVSEGADWLHANSLQLTPDGNILLSVRHQDWVIKIDYDNGQGSGNILWRLGKQGDFRVVSNDPDPWFSHQHDARLLGDGSTFLVFDNGNVRRQTDPEASSRGQVFQLDEQNRVAVPVLNAVFGYSGALGSAQKLRNGNYHFNTGFLDGGRKGQSLEIDAAGNIVYAIEFATPVYRSFRLPDLYTPDDDNAQSTNLFTKGSGRRLDGGSLNAGPEPAAQRHPHTRR